MSKQGPHGIAWTDATWNPVRGCSRVSEGCRNCYAERVAARFSAPGQPYHGLARMTKAGPRWTGKTELVAKHLRDPLRWKRPRRIFVNSMSDLFHESLPDEDIDRVFAVMGLAQQHQFQVLTKRPQRMAAYLADSRFREEMVGIEAEYLSGLGRHVENNPRWPFPLPNVWLGVSIENQAIADERIPLLLQTPAAVRFVSAEPLLGSVNLRHGDWIPPLGGGPKCTLARPWEIPGPSLDWVIVGGESGPSARPMHPDWARSLRDQCQVAGVAYFFKQWGEWGPDPDHIYCHPTSVRSFPRAHLACDLNTDGTQAHFLDTEAPPPSAERMARMGKRVAGRLLDGHAWNEFPHEVGKDAMPLR